jgi:hypothetical protein
MTIWFNKKVNGEKRYCGKSITIRYHLKNWKLLQWKSNGALKGNKQQTCYDLNIYFLGLFFSYTNWDFNKNL